MQWFKHTSIIATLVLVTSAAFAVSNTTATTNAKAKKAKPKTVATAVKTPKVAGLQATQSNQSTTPTTQTSRTLRPAPTNMVRRAVSPNAMKTNSMKVAAMPPISASSSSALSTISTSKAEVAPKEEKPVFSGFVQAARSTSLYDFQDGTRQDGMDYTLRLAANLGDSYNVKLTAIYAQDLNNPTANDFKDTNIAFARKPTPLGDYLGVVPMLGVAFATSKASKAQELEYAGKAGLVGLIGIDKLITGTSATLALVGQKNIHKYETSTTGTVNNSYLFVQNLTLGYGYKDVSLTLDFVHVNMWSYQDVMRDVFEMTQELGWAINKTFTVAIGHTNGGSTLKADGISSNVQVMNENSSMVYASTTISF
jgi:hypothetical protein